MLQFTFNIKISFTHTKGALPPPLTGGVGPTMTPTRRPTPYEKRGLPSWVYIISESVSHYTKRLFCCTIQDNYTLAIHSNKKYK